MFSSLLMKSVVSRMYDGTVLTNGLMCSLTKLLIFSVLQPLPLMIGLPGTEPGVRHLCIFGRR